jgi:hypothetical protein
MNDDPEEAPVDAVEVSWQRFLEELRRLPGSHSALPSFDQQWEEQ